MSENTKLITTIEPFYTDKTGISSHSSEFYIKNGSIYTNLQNIQTGEIVEKSKMLSRILSINVVSDPENENMCNVKVSYLNNNKVEVFNEFNNMTLASAQKLIDALKSSNANITLKQNNVVLKKAKRQIDWSQYGEQPQVTARTTTNQRGFTATTAAPAQAVGTQTRLGARQTTSRNTPTPRHANEKNQGVYVAKGADLFLTDEEKKEFYRPAPTVRRGRISSPNKVAAAQERAAAPLVPEQPTEKKKKSKPKKEPLRKRIAKRFFKPKEEKAKPDLWKNGLKDITTAGLRIGSAALVILSVAGAFIPILGIAMFIAGVVGLVATDTVIDFAEDTVKNLAKGASAGVEKSKLKKQAKAEKKLQKSLEKENKKAQEQVEKREIDSIRNELNNPTRHEEPQLETRQEKTTSIFDDILGPSRTNKSRYASSATHADTRSSSVVRGRNGFDQITMPAKVSVKDSDDLATGLDEWQNNVTGGFHASSGTPRQVAASTTTIKVSERQQLKEKNEDEKFKRQLGGKNKIDRDRTFGN